MSRWHDEFENHPFQPTWKKLLELAKGLTVDDGAILTSVQEAARFKKVTIYLDDLLTACDKELVPLTTWANFDKQCNACFSQVNSYNSNRNIQHLSTANSHLDNLMSYLKPYVVDARSAAKASTLAQKAYQSTIIDHIDDFKNTVNKANAEIQQILGNAQETIKAITDISIRADDFNDKMFRGLDNVMPIELKAEEWINAIEEFHSKIYKYNDSIFESGSGNNSVEYKIDQTLNNLMTDKEAAEVLLKGVNTKISDLNKYYVKIFGDPTSKSPKSFGLKEELETRKAELYEFKNEHEAKHKAFVNQIESLVPGATTAGLSTAYSDLRSTASASVAKFNILFSISLIGLMFLSSIFTIQSFTLEPFNMTFVNINDWNDALKLVFQRVPFILPLIWLAIFASKRRSEFHRLEQEYAHKEATAKSYQSFKQQIHDLGEAKEHQELLIKLISTAVDTVSFNASTTLDKKHGDKMPSHTAIDGFINLVDKGKKVFK